MLATGQVTTIAGSPGAPGSSDGAGGAARFGAIENLAWCGGNLYAADSFYYTVRKIAVAGNMVTTLAGTAGMSGGQDGTGAAVRFYQPGAVSCDGSGNLYVADSIAVRKIALASGAVTTLAATITHRGNVDATGTAARFNTPTGLAADGAGNVYVADSMNNSIRKVATATAAVTTLAGGVSGNIDGTGAAAGFTTPQGLGWDGGGNLYVADTGNHTIRKIVIATGAVTTLAGTGGMSGTADGTGAAARFLRPTGVTADRAGNVYVADTGNHTIRQIVAATGVVTTIAGTAKSAGYVDAAGTAARFSGPGNLIYDGSGTLYIADTNNSRIRQLALATGAVTTLVGYQAPPPISEGLALDGAGNLYVADAGYGITTPQATVRRVDLATGAVTTVLGGTVSNAVVPGPSPASLNYPWGLAWVPNQGLFISDHDENALLLAH